MSCEIHKLNEDRLTDFLSFFTEGNQCFCVSWTGDGSEESDFDSFEVRRNYAIGAIKKQKLRGYLAYDQNNVIGWCNTNTKNQCDQCEGWQKILTSVPSEKPEKTKSIFCFSISPDYQKQGVASKLLARIIKDARTERYVYLAAYPDKMFNELYQEFMGPKRLYQKFGFEVVDEIEDKRIMRKTLVN